MTDAQTEARAIAQKLQDVVDANAADYPTVAAQQCRHHQPGCGLDREAKMITVAEGVFCDPCIAPLVAALNAAGVETIASCCGHTHRPGCIALRDGRELIIAQDYDEARKIEAMFPVDINGNTALSTITPAEVGGLVAELRNPDFRGSMQHLRSAGEIDRLFQQAAAILEAQAAELTAMEKSQMRQAAACGVATARYERAEAGERAAHDAANTAIRQRDEARAQLAEARKALGALDRMSRGVDWCDQDEQARRWEAARRALEAQGGENG